jgi:hypothetical protein
VRQGEDPSPPRRRRESGEVASLGPRAEGADHHRGSGPDADPREYGDALDLRHPVRTLRAHEQCQHTRLVEVIGERSSWWSDVCGELLPYRPSCAEREFSDALATEDLRDGPA